MTQTIFYGTFVPALQKWSEGKNAEEFGLLNASLNHWILGQSVPPYSAFEGKISEMADKNGITTEAFLGRLFESETALEFLGLFFGKEKPDWLEDEVRHLKKSLPRHSYIMASDMPLTPMGDLTPEEMEAVKAALDAQKKAYAPYSNYKVGVSVVSASGKIYTGVNVENCAYVVPHGEWNALSEMAKNGERRFKILVCAARENGIPCFICRQFMREFSGENLDEVIVIGVALGNPEMVIRCTFGQMVGIDSFGPESLGVHPTDH